MDSVRCGCDHRVYRLASSYLKDLSSPNDLASIYPSRPATMLLVRLSIDPMLSDLSCIITFEHRTSVGVPVKWLTPRSESKSNVSNGLTELMTSMVFITCSVTCSKSV